MSIVYLVEGFVGEVRRCERVRVFGGRSTGGVLLLRCGNGDLVKVV